MTIGVFASGAMIDRRFRFDFVTNNNRRNRRRDRLRHRLLPRSRAACDNRVALVGRRRVIAMRQRARTNRRDEDDVHGFLLNNGGGDLSN